MAQLLTFVVLVLLIFGLSGSERVKAHFNPLPVQAKAAAWVVIFSAVFGISEAVVERRFIAAAAENTVAWLLHIALLTGTFGGAFWIGDVIYKKLQYKTKWVGIVLGIAAAAIVIFVLGRGLYHVLLQIPGIGWRLERQMSSDE